eukprot:5384258-Prymnesium_polylepis.1
MNPFLILDDDELSQIVSHCPFATLPALACVSKAARALADQRVGDTATQRRVRAQAATLLKS